MKKTIRIKSFMLQFDGDAETGAALLGAVGRALSGEPILEQRVEIQLPPRELVENYEPPTRSVDPPLSAATGRRARLPSKKRSRKR